MTSSGKLLLTFQQLDPWLQFNPYLATGYRPRMSIRAALQSFFQWHNESVNIWTHSLAACLMLYIVLFPPTGDIAVSPRFSSRAVTSSATSPLDIGPTAVFRSLCLVFFFMFSMSVVYHLLMPCAVSAVGYNRLLHCDVIGIVFCLTGSAWSIFYRGNACASDASCHATAAVLTFSLVVVLYRILFVHSSTDSAVERRTKAIGMQCALRLAAMLWLEVPKAQTQGYHLALHYHIASHLYIVIGGMVNAFRFPEKQLRYALARGGRFWGFVGKYVTSSEEVDYVWNSHNLWHIFAMFGVTSTLFGCYYDLVEFELARC